MEMLLSLKYRDMSNLGVIFVLENKGKILIQQRDKNCKFFPFSWCIPGGGREKGESYRQTLIREVKEEFNICLKSKQCKYIFDFPKKGNKVYLCHLLDEQNPELGEGMNLDWKTIKELEDMDLGFEQNSLIPLLRDKIID